MGFKSVDGYGGSNGSMNVMGNFIRITLFNPWD